MTSYGSCNITHSSTVLLQCRSPGVSGVSGAIATPRWRLAMVIPGETTAERMRSMSAARVACHGLSCTVRARVGGHGSRSRRGRRLVGGEGRSILAAWLGLAETRIDGSSSHPRSGAARVYSKRSSFGFPIHYTPRSAAVDGCQDPRKSGAAKKIGMPFARTSASPRRRMPGGEQWLGGKLCQGLQPPKAGPQARLYRACHPAILGHRGRRLGHRHLLSPPSLRGFHAAAKPASRTTALLVNRGRIAHIVAQLG